MIKYKILLHVNTMILTKRINMVTYNIEYYWICYYTVETGGENLENVVHVVVYTNGDSLSFI